MRLGNRLMDAVIQQQAVGQARQNVMMSQKLDMLLLLFTLADVGKTADIMRHRTAVIPHYGNGQPFRKYLSILSTIPDLAIPVIIMLELAPQLLIECPILSTGFKQGRGLPNHLFRRITSNLLQ